MWIADAEKMKRGALAGILCLMIISISCSALGKTKQLTKEWNTAIVIGSFSNDSHLRYYLQPQLNFVDDKYKFQNAYLFLGLGYQFSPHIRFWLMDGLLYIKKQDGGIARRDTIRQQMDWLAADCSDFKLITISRLEERKEVGESRWAIRVRERLMLRIPFKNWEGHSMVLYDEAFFDLNHSKWIKSNTFLAQNRAFVGISTAFSKQVALDAGYLNQYQMKDKDTVSNVLALTLNVLLV